MIVSMWMTRDVVTIEPATPITQAAAVVRAVGAAADDFLDEIRASEHHVLNVLRLP